MYHCRLLFNGLADFMLELDGCFVSQMSEMTHVTSLHLFQASQNLFLQSASNIKMLFLNKKHISSKLFGRIDCVAHRGSIFVYDICELVMK